jgi:hypothetical protein
MKPARQSSANRRSFPGFSMAAGAAFLLWSAPHAQAAVICENGIGDTEIQCIVKGSAGTHQSLSVTSQLGSPVEVLVTQWTGSCSKIENFSRADNLAVPAAKTATVSVAVPTAAQCASVLFSECKHVGQVDGKSVVKPFFCGELLTVKGTVK